MSELDTKHYHALPILIVHSSTVEQYNSSFPTVVSRVHISLPILYYAAYVLSLAIESLLSKKKMRPFRDKRTLLFLSVNMQVLSEAEW